MSSSKFTVWVVATTILFSLGFVLYPQGSASAAKFCAELRGAAGRLNCSFTSLLLIYVASRVSRARQGWGRRALPQMAWRQASLGFSQ